ncbi:hypothetical protein BT96DRAFT_941140 [Gymnopus androsaceus JB14]|uniref:Uncharacterized protein n=1 Tax=Gymnopus androsaceus JB14 TaxID=1447944 RepID=A0A6A4HJ03_9AGAR|nr:hypothetical protein BT96DRAFT_941140 [Gymnopus androsaceus JB14]
MVAFVPFNQLLFLKLSRPSFNLHSQAFRVKHLFIDKSFSLAKDCINELVPMLFNGWQMLNHCPSGSPIYPNLWLYRIEGMVLDSHHPGNIPPPSPIVMQSLLKPVYTAHTLESTILEAPLPCTKFNKPSPSGLDPCQLPFQVNFVANFEPNLTYQTALCLQLVAQSIYTLSTSAHTPFQHTTSPFTPTNPLLALFMHFSSHITMEVAMGTEFVSGGRDDGLKHLRKSFRKAWNCLLREGKEVGKVLQTRHLHKPSYTVPCCIEGVVYTHWAGGAIMAVSKWAGVVWWTVGTRYAPTQWCSMLTVCVVPVDGLGKNEPGIWISSVKWSDSKPHTTSETGDLGMSPPIDGGSKLKWGNVG